MDLIEKEKINFLWEVKKALDNNLMTQELYDKVLDIATFFRGKVGDCAVRALNAIDEATNKKFSYVADSDFEGYWDESI